MKNSKKLLTLFIIFIACIGLVYLAYANFGKISDANSNIVVNTNSTNTNDQTPPPTDTDSLPDDTNTTTPTIETTDKVFTAAELTTNPELYNNQQVCATGYYQESFEFTALSPAYHLDSKGDKYLDKPYIWIDFTVPSAEQINCHLTPVGQRTCFGQITVCGIFQYASPKQEGFGHVNAYRYQLTQADN